MDGAGLGLAFEEGLDGHFAVGQPQHQLILVEDVHGGDPALAEVLVGLGHFDGVVAGHPLLLVHLPAEDDPVDTRTHKLILRVPLDLRHVLLVELALIEQLLERVELDGSDAA